MHKTIIIIALFALAVAALSTAALAQTGAAPRVTGIAITSSPAAGSTYGKGETISAQVTFSSSVTVAAGVPRLWLLMDHGYGAWAEYTSGSGTDTLTFSYTVQAGDRDTDGISFARNALQGRIVQTGATTTAALANAVVPAASGHKVNGGPLPPEFWPTDMVTPQVYTKGTAVSLTLPQARSAAATGTAPLTYTLTGPSSAPQLPAGLVFDAATRVLSGTSTGWQDTIRYTYTATDANQNTASMPVDITVNADFDADNDQLIEVHNLAQLNAIRWDLDGDGDVSAQTATVRASYRAAYPGVAGMGCKAVDHDNNTTTPNKPVCIGYELNNNLDFDTDGDGATYTITAAATSTPAATATPAATSTPAAATSTPAAAATSTPAAVGDSGDSYYNGGQGWTPIGDATNPFTAIFNGNNKTIANLFIKSVGANALSAIGLFGVIGKCDTTGDNCKGEVKNLGLLDAKIIRNHTLGGHVGALAGRLYGAVTGCYADGGAMDHTVAAYRVVSSTGGLIGNVNGGTVTGSYAKVSVTSRGAGNVRTGGLAGRNGGTITVSYATGDVIGAGRGFAGGLVGLSIGGGDISASYAAGSVSHPDRRAGGLVGNNYNVISTITASYAIGTISSTATPQGLTAGGTVSASYWDVGGTGASSSDKGTGKTTTELQSPTSTVGIYSTWSASQWDFGTSRQYPAVKHNGKLVPGQRESFIRADNPAAPVVGEPVVAGLNVTGATSTVWQWQRSPGGAAWSDIAGAAAATYIPTTTDVGNHLRAKATFTTAERSRTVTTFNTAKVVASPSATASDATSFIPVIGSAKIRFSLSAAGASNPSIWRWQRCNDAAMLTGCKFITSSEPASNAYTEYTPTAGSDTDVGKYLQAYVYYADGGNGNGWTRGETPVLGPVAAAPAAPAPTQ